MESYEAKDIADSPTRLHFCDGDWVWTRCKRWGRPNLFFILLIHFFDETIPERIKEFGPVHFPGSEFQIRLIEVPQINIKGAFKIFGYNPYIVAPIVKNTLIM